MKKIMKSSRHEHLLGAAVCILLQWEIRGKSRTGLMEVVS